MSLSDIFDFFDLTTSVMFTPQDATELRCSVVHTLQDTLIEPTEFFSIMAPVLMVLWWEKRPLSSSWMMMVSLPLNLIFL